MAKIKQVKEDGTEEEIEVVTPEEVAAEKARLEGEHKNIVTEKDTTIDTLAKEKVDLEAKIAKMELEGIKEDHPNFKILKEALSKKDVDIQNLKKEIDTDRTSRKQEAMDSEIKIASKGNIEFEKKVRLHLKDTLASLPEETVEQRKVKLEAAVKLSSDNSGSDPSILDGGIGGGGMGGGQGGGEGGSGVEFTAREKALGSKFGITDADYKKYGHKLSKK
jgi:hypothetical protein